MSGSIHTTIKSLSDGMACQVRLTSSDGSAKRYDCIYKEDVAPDFFLAFDKGVLPQDVDTDVACKVFFDDLKPPVTIDARTLLISGSRALSMRGYNTFDPSTMREYFRVEIETEIIANNEYDHLYNNAEFWEITGHTVDISGTGILARFKEDIPAAERVDLSVYLEYYNEEITCQARIIRSRRMRNKTYLIAFELQEIDQKKRDKLITCCLHEQRKSLRTKVQTVNHE